MVAGEAGCADILQALKSRPSGTGYSGALMRCATGQGRRVWPLGSDGRRGVDRGEKACPSRRGRTGGGSPGPLVAHAHRGISSRRGRVSVSSAQILRGSGCGRGAARRGSPEELRTATRRCRRWQRLRQGFPTPGVVSRPTSRPRPLGSGAGHGRGLHRDDGRLNEG